MLASFEEADFCHSRGKKNKVRREKCNPIGPTAFPVDRLAMPSRATIAYVDMNAKTLEAEEKFVEGGPRDAQQLRRVTSLLQLLLACREHGKVR